MDTPSYICPLFGSYQFPDEIYPFLALPAIQRLKGISLSSVPDWVLPIHRVGTRFDHTLGVLHLATLLQVPATVQLLFLVAAVFHDAGSPPFSHLTEPFMVDQTGKNHEQQVAYILKDPEVDALCKRHGIWQYEILNLVTGKYHSLAPLLNGLVDVDNLDNVCRYLLNSGIYREVSPRTPQTVAKNLRVDDGGVFVQDEYASIAELYAWANYRTMVYRFVYSDANLLPGAMYLRAIHLIRRTLPEERLPNHFWSLTDRAADAFLLSHGSGKSQAGCLLEDATNGKLYRPIIETSAETPTYRGRTVNPLTRQLIADDLASEVGIPPNKICVYYGREHWHRPVSTLIRNGSTPDTPLALVPFSLRVFIHEEYYAGSVREQLLRYLRSVAFI